MHDDPAPAAAGCSANVRPRLAEAPVTIEGAADRDAGSGARMRIPRINVGASAQRVFHPMRNLSRKRRRSVPFDQRPRCDSRPRQVRALPGRRRRRAKESNDGEGIQGDEVERGTPQGNTRGTVTREVTGDAKAGGHTAKASTAEPPYEVESEKAGETAIHRPGALKKVG